MNNKTKISGCIVLVSIFTGCACAPSRTTRGRAAKAPSVPSAKASAVVVPARYTGTSTSFRRVLKDVTYCTVDEVDLKMDIYQPNAQDMTQPAPVVLFLHGGGWRLSDKSDVLRTVDIDQLNHRGFLVASINYRLAPRYKFPAMIVDAKCAVRYLKAHAEIYHINPDKISACGISSGGHLAALLGLAGVEAGWDIGAYPSVSSQVQAVVDMCGPTDLPPIADAPGNIQGLPAIFGTTNIHDPILTNASPVVYVTSNAPPFLIFHGDKDTMLPLWQSQELQRKLQAAGATAELVVVRDVGHLFKPIGPSITRKCCESFHLILWFLHQYYIPPEISHKTIDFLVQTLTP